MATEETKQDASAVSDLTLSQQITFTGGLALQDMVAAYRERQSMRTAVLASLMGDLGKLDFDSKLKVFQTFQTSSSDTDELTKIFSAIDSLKTNKP